MRLWLRTPEYSPSGGNILFRIFNHIYPIRASAATPASSEGW